MAHSAPSLTRIHLKIAGALSAAIQAVAIDSSLSFDIKLMRIIQLIDSYSTQAHWQEGIVLRVAYNHLAKKYGAFKESDAAKTIYTKTVPQFLSVVRALDPTKDLCPTLNDYAERPQFKRPTGADKNNDIRRLLTILLDSSFYVIAIQLDALAVVYWIYLMSFLHSVLENKMYDIYLEYYAIMKNRFDPQGFFDQLKSDAFSKKIQIIEFDGKVLTLVNNFFQRNVLNFNQALTSNVTTEFYMDQLSRLPFTAGFSYATWLQTQLIDLTSRSGFTALAEAINITAIANFKKVITQLEKSKVFIAVENFITRGLKEKSIELETARRQRWLAIFTEGERLELLKSQYVQNGGPAKTEEFDFYFGWNIALLLHGKSEKIPFLASYPGLYAEGYRRFGNPFKTIIEGYFEEEHRRAEHAAMTSPALAAPPRPSRPSDSDLPSVSPLSLNSGAGAAAMAAAEATELYEHPSSPSRPGSPSTKNGEYEFVPD